MKQIFLIYSVQGNQTQKTLNFFLSATCSTEEKIKGWTSHQLTIDDKYTHGWGKFTPPLPLPPSPSYPSLPTLSQSVLRFTTLHGKKRSRYKDLRSHLGIQCANPSLLQTPPSFEPYLPSKVLFLISLEYHSRPNSKWTRWQTRESGEYRPLQ